MKKTDVNHHGVDVLTQKRGGLFSGVSVQSTSDDEPEFLVCSPSLGNIGAVWPQVGKKFGEYASIRASGSGLDERAALLPALCEGIERYSTSVFHEEQLIWGTGVEFGDEALDLDSIPRCSEKERAHPKCPLLLADKTKPIRWTTGVSLTDGRRVLIPAVMVFAHVGYAVHEERFWFPISTGCAAHVSYEKAILAGIAEVVERDAISITWLQKLALPKIKVDRVSDHLRPYWERYCRAASDVEYVFFDATTDLGIPTVYGLQIARRSERLRTLVSCGTGTTMDEAMAKTIRDMAAVKLAFGKELSIPASWDDFTDLLHGATLMARKTSSEAFEFLLTHQNTTALSQSATTLPLTLPKIVERLSELDLQAYAIDLSTDEAIRSGLYVVRVIIPGLLPLSFRHRARFLDHPRLYTAPASMGYKVHSEDQINRWPQPFA